MSDTEEKLDISTSINQSNFSSQLKKTCDQYEDIIKICDKYKVNFIYIYNKIIYIYYIIFIKHSYNYLIFSLIRNVLNVLKFLKYVQNVLS